MNSTNKRKKQRLGQLYRVLSLRALLDDSDYQIAMDLGCHDGAWLETIPAGLRIGVDLKPNISANNVCMVMADVNHLPFIKGKVDIIYALELIEHLEEEMTFSSEIARVLRTGGNLVLTTPAEDIHIFPSIFTGWISRMWGHRYRLGYSPEILRKIFNKNFSMQIRRLKSKEYLKNYLGLRLLHQVNPNLAKKYLEIIVKKDLRDPWGEHGYLLLKGERLG